MYLMLMVNIKKRLNKVGTKMRDLLSVTEAVKMIRREREKFPNELLETLIHEYNNDWFDGTLTTSDLRKIESAYLRAFPE